MAEHNISSTVKFYNNYEPYDHDYEKLHAPVAAQVVPGTGQFPCVPIVPVQPAEKKMENEDDGVSKKDKMIMSFYLWIFK